VRKLVISQLGLGWLKNYSFHLLPYMAIARQLVTSGWGGSYAIFRFEFGSQGMLSVLNLLLLG